jgi:hypothetical protein
MPPGSGGVLVVVVVELDVVVLLDVVVELVDVVVVVVDVGGFAGSTTMPRLDDVRSLNSATSNSVDADVPWSFGPAIPDLVV